MWVFASSSSTFCAALQSGRARSAVRAATVVRYVRNTLGNATHTIGKALNTTHCTQCSRVYPNILKRHSHSCAQARSLVRSQRVPGTHDDSPPDLCDASCFLALQVVLAQNASTKAQDDDFCSACAPKRST